MSSPNELLKSTEDALRRDRPAVKRLLPSHTTMERFAVAHVGVLCEYVAELHAANGSKHAITEAGLSFIYRMKDALRKEAIYPTKTLQCEMPLEFDDD